MEIEGRSIVYRGIPLVVFENGEIWTADRKISKSNGDWNIKGRKLSQHIDKYGYSRVRISVANRRMGVLAHRIVATAFIPNPNDLPCVNHKDENKANNRIENLEWCDVSYNNHYNKRYEKMRRNNKAVLQLTIEGKVIGLYSSIKEAAQSVNGTPSNIGSCAHGRLLSAYGYKWQFYNR